MNNTEEKYLKIALAGFPIGPQKFIRNVIIMIYENAFFPRSIKYLKLGCINEPLAKFFPPTVI